MDETEKSSVTTAEEPKDLGVAEGDGPEEGEIIGDDEASSAAAKPSRALAAAHPLEHSWTFWFDSPAAKSKASSWGSSLRPVYTFHAVEEFWGIYNNIHHPSKMGAGADFYCFKSEIEPKWEDPICANGGKWTVTYSRDKSDTSWLYSLLAMIGEQFEHGDEICGAVVNVRARQEKISLWTKNASNEAAQTSIGQQWKKFLDYNENIGYIFHDDAKKHDRGAKNRYNC